MAVLTSFVFGIAIVNPLPVHADDPEYSDTTYWTDHCKSVTTGSDASLRQACAAFTQYMADTSSSLEAQLTEIDASRAEIAANIEEYENQIADYQTKIDDLAGQIDDLTNQISDLQTNIDELTKQEEELREKVKMQLSTNQKTMRLSKYWDLLMGARTMSEFLAIFNGLNDISKHNDETLTDYQNTVTQLQADQESLNNVKAEKETAQNDYISQQYQVQVIQEEAENQKGELDKQYTEAQLTKEAMEATAAQLAEEQANAQKAYEAEVARAQEEARQKAAAEAAARQQSSSSSSSTTSYGGSVTVNNDGTLGTQIVQYAMQFLGYPYVWGAAGPNAFDCSGFTQYVYGHFGIYLYHYTGVQETAGYAVSRDQTQAGDLVLWEGHVAIIMGWYNGTLYCINAMNPQAGVCTIPVDWMGKPVKTYRRVI